MLISAASPNGDNYRVTAAVFIEAEMILLVNDYHITGVSGLDIAEAFSLCR